VEVAAVTTLRWSRRSTVDGRFRIQAERIRGEPICYALMCSAEDGRRAASLDLETAFFGRGGFAEAKAAAQVIADAYPKWDRTAQPWAQARVEP
jgi:hypothetical protein